MVARISMPTRLRAYAIDAIPLDTISQDSQLCMRILELSNSHRREHFEFFTRMNHPHFGVCAQVEVAAWIGETKRRGLHLTSSIVYLLARAANAVAEFRQRIRDEQIVEHDVVHPSFAVRTENTDVFSFCEVEFTEDFAPFVARSLAQADKRRTQPTMSDKDGRDDYLFMSAFPWVSFTGVMHPMQYHPHDSVPRLTWGKLYESGSGLRMPLSVQAHHAVVDGIHMGRFFQAVETLVDSAEEVMNGQKNVE